MLHTLSARAFLMVGEGASLPEAIRWVTRNLPVNLRPYYARQIHHNVCCDQHRVVKIVGRVAVVQCQCCGRGELIPQSRADEVMDFRARVSEGLYAAA